MGTKEAGHEGRAELGLILWSLLNHHRALSRSESPFPGFGQLMQWLLSSRVRFDVETEPARLALSIAW